EWIEVAIGRRQQRLSNVEAVDKIFSTRKAAKCVDAALDSVEVRRREPRLDRPAEEFAIRSGDRLHIIGKVYRSVSAEHLAPTIPQDPIGGAGSLSCAREKVRWHERPADDRSCVSRVVVVLDLDAMSPGGHRPVGYIGCFALITPLIDDERAVEPHASAVVHG